MVAVAIALELKIARRSEICASAGHDVQEPEALGSGYSDRSNGHAGRLR
jgi:hypothetical protein